MVWSCILLFMGMSKAVLAEKEDTDFLYLQKEESAEDDVGADIPDLLEDEYFENDNDRYDNVDAGQIEIYDPLEPLNRVIFVFNDKVYFWLLKPVKSTYTFFIPEDFRKCFRNFFNNVASPISFVNNIFQGNFKDAGVVFSRLLINSTAGVFGFADVASTEFNLKPRYADFGQTLGAYGFGEGFYINWPVFGPSHVRGTVGFAGDVFANPVTYINLTPAERVAYSTTKRINSDSLRPVSYEDLVKFSLDPYVSVRQSYYDFRRNILEKRGENRPDN